jgi:micrococcal nuclease
MQKKVLILVLFALMVLGGKMLPQSSTGAQTAPVLAKPDFNKTDRAVWDGLSPVVRIVDGDTIVVEIDGVQEKVRLIGVDTPEVVDPRKPVQCFGKEASVFTKNLLIGKRVRLEADPTQGDRDKYHRLLRYVFLGDGTLVNKKIIVEGYGHEYTYRIPYRYQTEFKTAERSAREAQKGLWAPNVCNK